MRVTYGIMSAADDFVKEQYDIKFDYERNALVRFEDGEPVTILALDGGEPEDNSFFRDWRWVPVALERAYNEGYKRGLADALDMD